MARVNFGVTVKSRSQESEHDRVGRLKPGAVKTSGYNRLKPPRSILYKWSILVDSGQLVKIELFTQNKCIISKESELLGNN